MKQSQADARPSAVSQWGMAEYFIVSQTAIPAVLFLPGFAGRAHVRARGVVRHLDRAPRVVGVRQRHWHAAIGDAPSGAAMAVRVRWCMRA